MQGPKSPISDHGGGKDSFMERSMKIAGVVALYWFVSISMVFLNRFLMSDVQLDAPIFVTWFQCVVAVATCAALGTMRDQARWLAMFPRFTYDLSLAKQILPLSVVFVGMIAFNNLTLKYVGVAFYNVGRSSTTIFNVILSYIMLKKTTSLRALLMCGVIIAGFFVGVDQEKQAGALDFAGIFCCIMASLCVALNSIYIKKVLPLVNNDMWRLTAYNNANAAFLFLPVMFLMGEIPEVMSSPEIYNTRYWLLMTLAGVFGIAIGLVTMLQIDFTSPLTHNISGTAKACAQTILALWITNETRSATWWMSNLMVLGGSLAYALIQQAEMRAAMESLPTRNTDGGSGGSGGK